MTLLKNEITFGSNRCFLGYEKWGFDFTYWGVMDRLQVEEYGTEYEDNVPAHTLKFFPFEFENACPINFSYDGKTPYKFSGSPDLHHRYPHAPADRGHYGLQPDLPHRVRPPLPLRGFQKEEGRAKTRRREGRGSMGG